MGLVKISSVAAVNPSAVVAVIKHGPFQPGCGIDDENLAGHVVVVTERGEHCVTPFEGQSVAECFDAVLAALSGAGPA